jgi:hypothetical protein
MMFRCLSSQEDAEAAHAIVAALQAVDRGAAGDIDLEQLWN